MSVPEAMAAVDKYRDAVSRGSAASTVARKTAFFAATDGRFAAC